MKDEISQLPREPREAFLLRVAAFYIDKYAPDFPIRYDQANCDGYCVVAECKAAAEDIMRKL